MIQDSKSTQVTTSDREHNPKAVFFGDLQDVINSLALYLNSHNVDLFSGKNLQDAFFGDYFFYTGNYLDVKSFLEKNGGQLPKTILLCPWISVLNSDLEIIDKSRQIKLVWLSQKLTLDDSEVEKIIEFFFAQNNKVLNLAQLASSGQSDLQPSPEVIISEEEKKITKLIIEEPLISIQSQVKEDQPEHDTVPNKTFQKPMDSFPASAGDDKQEEISYKNFSADLSTENIKPVAFEKSIKNLYLDPKQTGGISNLHKKQLPLLPAAILGLILFLLLPFLGFFTESLLVYGYISQGKKSLSNLQVKESQKYFKTAVFLSDISQKNVNFLEPLFSIVKQKQIFQGLQSISRMGSRVASGGLYLSQAAAEVEILVGGISGQDQGTPYGQTISATKGFLSLVDAEFAQAQAELKSESTQELLAKLHFDSIQNLEDDLSEIREGIVTGRELLSLAPEVLGLYGERTFLVLFQNNMELRPTGGFIGSFGLLTFADGTLKDFRVEDIYTADGALKGHVEPPDPIKVHLPQEHWYMRDSNWDPDFERSGARAAWFLDKELGIQVDGVIAVDLSFVRELLAVSGPIDVSDFNQTISSDNLFLTVHNQVHEDFFPGSTKKKDLLGSIGRGLFEKLISQKQIANPALAAVLYQSFSQKHGQLYFVSPGLQSVARLIGWDGGIKYLSSCKEVDCADDFLMTIDANLGVNKSNYYVQKTLTDQVSLGEDGGVRHELELHYKNTSPKSDTVGGNYKNYLRVYVPDGALLESAYVDRVPLEIQTGSVATEAGVLVENQGRTSIFSLLVNVPVQSESRVSLTYVAPKVRVSPEYVLHLEKQSGTEADPVNIVFNFPGNSHLKQLVSKNQGNIAGASTVERLGKFTYNSQLREDEVIRITSQ